jgi:hypothetical protein
MKPRLGRARFSAPKRPVARDMQKADAGEMGYLPHHLGLQVGARVASQQRSILRPAQRDFTAAGRNAQAPNRFAFAPGSYRLIEVNAFTPRNFRFSCGFLLFSVAFCCFLLNTSIDT